MNLERLNNDTLKCLFYFSKKRYRLFQFSEQNHQLNSIKSNMMTRVELVSDNLTHGSSHFFKSIADARCTVNIATLTRIKFHHNLKKYIVKGMNTLKK